MQARQESVAVGEETELAMLLGLAEAFPLDAFPAAIAFADRGEVPLRDALAGFVDIVDERVFVRRAVAEAWFERGEQRVVAGATRFCATYSWPLGDEAHPWLVDYVRRWRLHHLTVAGDDEGACMLLADVSYLRARAEAGEIDDLAEQALTWQRGLSARGWQTPGERRRKLKGAERPPVDARDLAPRIAQLLHEHAAEIGRDAGAAERLVDLVVGGLMDTGYTRDEIAAALPDVRERPLLRLVGRAVGKDAEAPARARRAELLSGAVEIMTSGEWFVVRTRNGAVHATRNDERVVTLARGGVNVMAAAPDDGKALVFGMADGRVVLLADGVRDTLADDQSGAQRGAGHHDHAVAGLRWLSDDVFVSWDEAGDLVIRDVRRGSLEGWQFRAPITSVDDSGVVIVVGTTDGVVACIYGDGGPGRPVEFLDKRTGRAPIETMHIPNDVGSVPGQKQHWARATSHGSALVGVAVCAGRIVSVETAGTLRIHDADGTPTERIRDHGTAAVVGMCATPRHPGDVVTEPSSRRVVTWDAEGGVVVREVSADASEVIASWREARPVSDVAWIAEPRSDALRARITIGNTVITRRIQLASAFEEVARHDSEILDACMLPGEPVLATVSDDHSLRIWDIESREQLARFGPPTESSVAIASAVRNVLTFHGREIRMTGPGTPDEIVATVRTVEPDAWSVARDGLHVLVLGGGRLLLHDLEVLALPKDQRSKSGWRRNVAGAVGCALSYEGDIAAVWHVDRTIVLRRVDTALVVASWEHPCGVRALLIDSDGVVHTLGDDGLHRSWWPEVRIRLSDEESAVDVSLTHTSAPTDPPILGMDVGLFGFPHLWTRRAFGAANDEGKQHVDVDIERLWAPREYSEPEVALLEDGRLVVVRSSAHEQVVLRPRGARLVDVATLPDERLVTLTVDGRLTVWDIDARAPISHASVSAPARGLLVHDEGRLITVVDAAGWIAAYEFASDELQQRQRVPRIIVRASPFDEGFARHYASMLRAQGVDAMIDIAPSIEVETAGADAIHALLSRPRYWFGFTRELVAAARDRTGPVFVPLTLDKDAEARWSELSRTHGLITASMTVSAERDNSAAVMHGLAVAAARLAWSSGSVA